MTDSPIREFGDTARLYDALAAAQGKFPTIEKRHKAKIKAGFEYMYADIADVLAAVRPVLSENGLAIMQMPVIIGDRMMIVTRLAHKTGTWIESDYPIAGISGGINHQTVGGALTYGKRYSLCAMIGVSAEEDTDEQANHEGADTQNAPWPAQARAEPPRRAPPVTTTTVPAVQQHLAASPTTPATEKTTAPPKKSLIDPNDALVIDMKAHAATWDELRLWHAANKAKIVDRGEEWMNEWYARYDLLAERLKKESGPQKQS